MRLPVRFRTRRAYVVMACFVALLLGSALFILPTLTETSELIFQGVIQTANVGALSAVAAAIAWPRRAPRSTFRMIVAGVVTILLALAFLGLTLSLSEMFSAIEGYSLWAGIRDLLAESFVLVLLGSISTFGIPYLIAVIVSIMFSDPN